MWTARDVCGRCDWRGAGEVARTGLAAAYVFAPDLGVAGLEFLHGGHAAFVVEQDDLDAAAGEEAEVAFERLGLADHHAGDLEEQDGAGAHLARGERGVQGGVEVGGAPAGVAQAGDLAVRHRVAALHALVVTGRGDVPADRQHRADRDAAAVQADPRLGQRERHHLAVGLIRLPVSHGGLRYRVRRQTTPVPVPDGVGMSSGRRPASVMPSLRGIWPLATFSSSCTISTQSTPGRPNACPTRASVAAVARPRPVYALRTQYPISRPP